VYRRHSAELVHRDTGEVVDRLTVLGGHIDETQVRQESWRRNRDELDQQASGRDQYQRGADLCVSVTMSDEEPHQEHSQDTEVHCGVIEIAELGDQRPIGDQMLQVSLAGQLGRVLNPFDPTAAGEGSAGAERGDRRRELPQCIQPGDDGCFLQVRRRGSAAGGTPGHCLAREQHQDQDRGLLPVQLQVHHVFAGTGPGGFTGVVRPRRRSHEGQR
jgi:hypothetical protein